MPKPDTRKLLWGEALRVYREQLGLSQNEFADEIMHICAESVDLYPERFRLLRIDCPNALTSFEICRYEKGHRLPLRRSIHLQLLWVFVSQGVIATVDEANTWLEQGQQGWLSDRETAGLFGA